MPRRMGAGCVRRCSDASWRAEKSTPVCSRRVSFIASSSSRSAAAAVQSTGAPPPPDAAQAAAKMRRLWPSWKARGARGTGAAASLARLLASQVRNGRDMNTASTASTRRTEGRSSLAATISSNAATTAAAEPSAVWRRRVSHDQLSTRVYLEFKQLCYDASWRGERGPVLRRLGSSGSRIIGRLIAQKGNFGTHDGKDSSLLARLPFEGPGVR